VSVSELPPQQPRYQSPPPQPRYEGLPSEYDDPPPPYDDEPLFDDDDAQTRVINGMHRRGIGAALAQDDPPWEPRVRLS